MESNALAGSGFSFTVAERRALGPFFEVLKKPGVRDVLAQTRFGKAEVWIDSGKRLTSIGDLGLTPASLRDRATELIAVGGRHIDELEPAADVRIGGRLRVHALLEPLVAEGAAVSIRVQHEEVITLMSLFRAGLCDTGVAKQILQTIRERKNFLVTGATASGKTTLLKAMLSEVSEDERIITIEDVAEISLNHPHHLGLEARQANSEGVGAVSLDRLLRESLRMRPDRVVLGECRGAEIVTLLTALNTGHDGGASTLHANGIKEVPARLEALGLTAGLAPEALARQAFSALHTIIHVAREGRKHRVTELGRLKLTSAGLLAVEKA